MHILSTGIVLFAFLALPWGADFEAAKKDAVDTHRIILLNFSGSDWCSPCKRLKSEVFDSEVFTAFAEYKLVLLNADFPRLKKNALGEKQLKHNESLAERYNPEGKFPYTVLLDNVGRVLKTWEGLPPGGATRFVADLKAVQP